MRTRLVIAGCMLLGMAHFGAGCQRAENAPPPKPPSKSASAVLPAELLDVPAVVHRFPLDSDSWVLVDSSGTLWVPDALPAPFRSDGLAVVFSGRPRAEAVPERTEKPLELLHIARRSGRQS